MYQSIPKPPIPLLPPRAIPVHLTRVRLLIVGNLTQNEARLVGHLTFVSKRLSAVVSKRILQFFDSARERRSRVIALVDSTWVFLLLSFYIAISWNMPLFKVGDGTMIKKSFPFFLPTLKAYIPNIQLAKLFTGFTRKGDVVASVDEM